MAKEKLIPPDLKQCQAEIKSGSPFSFGPRIVKRCENKAKWLATEKNKGNDGQRGSMSMCDDCKKVFEDDFAENTQVTFKKIVLKTEITKRRVLAVED